MVAKGYEQTKPKELRESLCSKLLIKWAPDKYEKNSFIMIYKIFLTIKTV